MRIPAICTLALSLSAFVSASGSLQGAEKKLMHCFAFTVIDTATQADWQAFAKATESLPGQIPGLTKVWHGKLARPLTLYNPDAETRKKANAEGQAEGKVSKVVREHGVCMEMDGPDVLKAYAKHAAHDDWMKAYEKVRVAGTTTFDIVQE